MVKKLYSIVFTVIFLFNSPISVAAEPFQEDLFITQHWLSLTTSYDIETKTQKLGTLYRKFFSLLLTYEFYDPFDNKQAYAKSKFFSFNAHFDIYDTQDNILGSADEQLFAFFPTFSIYDKQGVTKLAYAKMNFWGTTFYIYDPVTDKEMAQMYRPFFRLKNNWTFKVTDQAVFNAKNIDNRVLMTVIAFQGDREYWESQDRNNNSYMLQSVNKTSAPSSNKTKVDIDMTQRALQNIELLKQKYNLNTLEKADPAVLEKLAKKYELEFDNAQSTANHSSLSRSERVQAFTDFLFTQVDSDKIDNSTKKAILYMLQLRFENANR